MANDLGMRDRLDHIAQTLQHIQTAPLISRAAMAVQLLPDVHNLMRQIIERIEHLEEVVHGKPESCGR